MKTFIILTLLSFQGIAEFSSSGNESMKENMATIEKVETATLGGGCFWCIEAVFNETVGVKSAISGYSGGLVKNPSYREVTTGRTGHAEVVQVTYDPDTISFENILMIFFSVHDPTTLNRQGADIGTQYRSVIFYHNNSQKEITENFINKLNSDKIFNNVIVTKVEPLLSFYEAEDYHQQYFKNNPEVGYCNYVIKPKMVKFRKEFSNMIR